MQENELKAFIKENSHLIYEYINKELLKDIGAMSPSFFTRLVDEYFKKEDKRIPCDKLTSNTLGYFLLAEVLGEAKQAFPFFRKDTLTLDCIFKDAKVYFNHVKFTIEDDVFCIYLIQTKAGVSTLEEEIIKYSKEFPMKTNGLDNFMKKTIPFVSGCDIESTNLWLEHLQAQMSEYQIVLFEDLSKEQKEDAKIAIVANPNPKDIAQLKNLKWVQSLWAGVEKILHDIPEASFKIVRMTDPILAQTMAQSVLAWSLYLHKNMPLYLKQQKQKQWKQHIELLPEEKNILVLGLGKLGLESVKKLKENGFSVSGWARSEKQIQGVNTYHGNDGLKKALKLADIVVCLLPLTSETKNLLDKKMLDLLPSGASIINFARGPIIDYDYVLQKIENSELSHAVLDVFDKEPLDENSPLWNNENITILPHISAPTNMKTASKIASKNICEYHEKGTIPEFVNIKEGY